MTVIRPDQDMTKDFAQRTGFGHAGRPRWTAQRTALALIATIALVISTLLVVTVVSIGIACAEMLVPPPAADDGRFAVALLLGVVLAGMGGLTAVTVLHGKRKPHDETPHPRKE